VGEETRLVAEALPFAAAVEVIALADCGVESGVGDVGGEDTAAPSFLVLLESAGDLLLPPPPPVVRNPSFRLGLAIPPSAGDVGCCLFFCFRMVALVSIAALSRSSFSKLSDSELDVSSRVGSLEKYCRLRREGGGATRSGAKDDAGVSDGLIRRKMSLLVALSLSLLPPSLLLLGDATGSSSSSKSNGLVDDTDVVVAWLVFDVSDSSSACSRLLRDARLLSFLLAVVPMPPELRLFPILRGEPGSRLLVSLLSPPLGGPPR
jgi:hypothetical protein